MEANPIDQDGSERAAQADAEGAGDSAASSTNKALVAHCKMLLSQGNRVEAVKAYRAATGAGLPEAQRALGIK